MINHPNRKIYSLIKGHIKQLYKSALINYLNSSINEFKFKKKHDYIIRHGNQFNRFQVRIIMLKIRPFLKLSKVIGLENQKSCHSIYHI